MGSERGGQGAGRAAGPVHRPSCATKAQRQNRLSSFFQRATASMKVRSLSAGVCRIPAWCSVPSTPLRQRVSAAGLQALAGSAAAVRSGPVVHWLSLRLQGVKPAWAMARNGSLRLAPLSARKSHSLSRHSGRWVWSIYGNAPLTSPGEPSSPPDQEGAEPEGLPGERRFPS